jgi:hypothetical protein
MADERETETESGEERIDEQGRNPTQQRMDQEGVAPAPVDASWTGEAEAPASSDAEVPGTSGPVEGSDPSTLVEAAAAANEPIFEPDVPLVAEVNREAGGGGSRKGVIAGVAGAFALLGAVLLRRRR